MKYAVLTGDIIKSHKLSVKLSKVQELLKSIPEQFNKKYGKSIESNLDIFRGDSWQLILYQENLAIRLALFIKAYLLSEQNVRTRISIGIGTVDKIEKNNVSESFGKAFELSGKGLDNLDNQQELYLATEDIHMKVEIKFLDCIF
ncbi:MAG: SatD family protein, partial [Candidatus Stygibacter australis]|nr:SatD family protein [Candidatus Stygibacter australis]